MPSLPRMPLCYHGCQINILTFINCVPLCYHAYQINMLTATLLNVAISPPRMPVLSCMMPNQYLDFAITSAISQSRLPFCFSAPISQSPLLLCCHACQINIFISTLLKCLPYTVTILTAILL